MSDNGGSPNAGTDSAVAVAEGAAGSFATTAVSVALSPDGTADPRVTAAFALGWQIAELYRPDRAHRSTPAAADNLPGLSELTRSEHGTLGYAQLTAGLAKLTPAVRSVGLELPAVSDLQKILATADGGPDRQAAFHQFHVALLTALTAADFRLGKAYGLGRALADTCMKGSDARTLGVELGHYRVETLRAWLEDLETALPPHSGEVVSNSLAAWSRWSDGGQAGFDTRTLGQLREQGRLWRSLLSGEKAATDMLQVEDYVLAATMMLRQTGRLARTFLFRHVLLVAAVFSLFAGGIAVMFAAKSNTASVVAGISGIVASFGLSWKGVGGSLGKAFGRLEQPLWSGALAVRITAAVSFTPGQKENPNFRDREPPPASSTAALTDFPEG